MGYRLHCRQPSPRAASIHAPRFMSALWSIIAFSITQTAVAQFGGPTSVVVAPVVERDIPPTVRLVGTVLPDKRAIVAAETSGALIEFIATEGQPATSAGTVSMSTVDG